jgi:hypothetical protein
MMAFCQKSDIWEVRGELEQQKSISTMEEQPFSVKVLKLRTFAWAALFDVDGLRGARQPSSTIGPLKDSVVSQVTPTRRHIVLIGICDVLAPLQKCRLLLAICHSPSPTTMDRLLARVGAIVSYKTQPDSEKRGCDF